MGKSKHKHGQGGLFGVQDQSERISELGGQLEMQNDLIDFKIFRADLVAALKCSDGVRGGRPAFDVVMMFKVLKQLSQMLNHICGSTLRLNKGLKRFTASNEKQKALIIQALNDLSDERAEFLIADRFPFLRFLGLHPGDKGPDHNTIWTFRGVHLM